MGRLQATVMKQLRSIHRYLVMLLALAAAPVLAGDGPDSVFKLSTDYALGVKKFHLDHETRIIGWRMSKSVYFGQQKGEDSGLTLVWQQEQNQVSLSKDGLRLTRRF